MNSPTLDIVQQDISDILSLPIPNQIILSSIGEPVKNKIEEGSVLFVFDKR